MFLSLFLTCFVALLATTGLLLAFGHRSKFRFRPLGLLLSIVVAAVAGEAAAWVWQVPARYALYGEILLVAFGLVTVIARPQWNPIGQAFYGSLLAAAVTYLSFAAWYTLFGGLSAVGSLASGVLFLLELFALTLAMWYAFDSCDVLCRVVWDRPVADPDPGHRPKVSLQIAAYNEPPDMLIESIRSVENIDYPSLQVLVIDNNTEDPEVWKPVEEYCRDRPRVTFVHVEGLEGFKAGALNLALTKYTDADAELVGVIDADYLLDPNYLNAVVGYFADPNLAFLQTPQDYRDWEGDPYLTACYDAYRYFFTTSMPSKNQRDSIIFAGTMGLIRRSVLEELGGWEEWCITEDAEASLRMLRAGYSGLYVHRSFGKGIMPLTFASLKSQRFRWCFGGLQILKRHWRDLLPWRKDPRNRLSPAQRLDYLFGFIHWYNDFVYLGFTVVLLTTAVLLVKTGRVGIRPLLGAVVLLPAALIASGLFRALWALRATTGIGTARALRAFANWLSMSWTVAVACAQSLFRSKSVFMRTPKTSEEPRPIDALRMTKAETFLAAALWGAAIAAGTTGQATPFLLALFLWQGAVYASSTYMAWLNVRGKLPPPLERRRRTEWLRERRAAKLAVAVGGAGGLVAAGVLAAVVLFGGLHPGTPENPFAVPRAPQQAGPLGSLIKGTPVPPAPSATPSSTFSPTPTASSSPSPTPSSSPSASPTPTSTSSGP